ncbi:MAG: gamma-glutamyl-gamma-aminobutyrate hydrolase family protein [Alphaproteobacteria bacterium]|jgi:para-aminobenzoate synthetase component 2|nr:gamma-glutamyl-gamma-aminobutyrate hydrolase family protein [Alphaproteobacteria bacterium]
MIVVLDSRDSFVHNLARMLRLAGGGEVRVVPAQGADVARLAPKALVLSPGPGRPSGALVRAVRALDVPILGVCLGHQAIALAYGGAVARAVEPLHGQACPVTHDGSALFAGVPTPFAAGRYHSLIAELPGTLRATAWSPAGEVMACAHSVRRVYGVQFHPESLLTPGGLTLLRNFVALAGIPPGCRHPEPPANPE